MGKTYFGKKEDEPVGRAKEREERRRSQYVPEEEYRREPQYRPEEEYDPDYEPGKRHLKKKKRKSKRVVIFVAEVIILLILALVLFVWFKFSKMQTVSIPKSEVVVNTEIDSAELKVLDGYTNIALYGVDSRQGQLTSDAHSDALMIASINHRTKEIKLVSVYRDTYLDNTNGEYRKATECYFFGGPQRSMSMLNKNLDLDIDKYVTVDFNVVADVVDMIGGVDIEVTEEEVQWINGYQEEGSAVTGKEIVPVTSAGYQTLNGLQALSYCRIRYTDGYDFRRTERQRTVLNQIFEKATQMDLMTLNRIVDTVLPDISTNLNVLDILSLAKDIASYSMGDTTGFPFNQVATVVNGSDVVVPVNLAENVRQLHEWMFGSTDYVPSATVQEISNQIIAVTGIQ
ncbi:MAG: LCP family protein [Candidatus Limivivens sp.]|nr:LCP family protein [Candidatus Limivivens sp.]